MSEQRWFVERQSPNKAGHTQVCGPLTVDEARKQMDAWRAGRPDLEPHMWERPEKQQLDARAHCGDGDGALAEALGGQPAPEKEEAKLSNSEAGEDAGTGGGPHTNRRDRPRRDAAANEVAALAGQLGPLVQEMRIVAEQWDGDVLPEEKILEWADKLAAIEQALGGDQ